MNFERKVIETLKDENGNEIVQGDIVVYKTKNKPQSVIAQFCGMEKGYMMFLPMGCKNDKYYTVQPKTIDIMFKANARDLFVLDIKEKIDNEF